MTFPNGESGGTFIYEIEDGYFSLCTCNAMPPTSKIRFDALLWANACFDHDLMGRRFDIADTIMCNGLASLTIRPQSADELMADLERFVTRISLAVESFRKATGSSPTASAPL